MNTVPSPPDFLINQFKKLEEQNRDSSEQTIYPASEVLNPITYKLALEERKEAEMAYAEIYSQYLEVVNFNEKLLRTVSRYDRFKDRIRPVFNRAKLGDKILEENTRVATRNLVAAEKAISDLQLENEALRTSLKAHEEAFNNLNSKLVQLESAIHQSRDQFGVLADEYENRGILLAESDRKIRVYLSQIETLETNQKIKTQEFEKIHDENLLLQNKVRDAQLHEAAIAALNVELVDSVTKLQKQVHEMNNKLEMERDSFQKSISAREQEIARLKDNLHVESIVTQSINIHKTPLGTPAQAQRQFDRKKIDGLYDRWSQVIDELSTHSTRIKPKSSKLEEITEQLISERGDLEII